MVKLQLIGVNHKTATVEVREKVLQELKKFHGTLLSTCNRVELYQNDYRNIYYEIDKELSVTTVLYHYYNKQVVLHLFRVACGLDSQVLGETEILGQVKETYLKNKFKNKLLDKIFETAIEVGKKVRQETGISRGNVSIASVVVNKAIKMLSNSVEKKVLILGAGKVAETVVKILYNTGWNIVFVANRTYEKASELAKLINGKVIYFDKLESVLQDTDLVICSTSAPHFILKKRHILQRNKPLFVIDLSVPRNVDPEIVSNPLVVLINIDDIQEEINTNLLRRKIEAITAEKIVEQEVNLFWKNFVSVAETVH